MMYSPKPFSKFGVDFTDFSTATSREAWAFSTKQLMQKLVNLHDKLYGAVGVRVIVLKNFKLVCNEKGDFGLIGDNTKVFPSPYTPLYEIEQFAPEVLYNESVKKWITNSLFREVVELEKKYAAYVTNLNSMVTKQESEEISVTTE